MTTEREKVDVLAVMDGAAQWCKGKSAVGSDLGLTDARAAVAELIETASRAEVSFNTVGACYRRNPGNFAQAMQQLDADVAPLRALLFRIGAYK